MVDNNLILQLLKYPLTVIIKMSDKKSVNLFLFAAPRCGSTQAAFWLDQHNDISMSSIKEPNFFSNEDFSKEYVKNFHLNDIDPDNYCKSGQDSVHQFAIFRERSHYDYLFSRINNLWLLDASTSYFQSCSAPLGVYRYNSNAKIIVLLRDPLNRSLSHYGLALRTGRTNRIISEEIQDEISGRTPKEGRYLIAPSMYHEAMMRIFDVFSSEQIKIVFFEDMIAAPGKVFNDIWLWLDLDDQVIRFDTDKQNKTALPRFPRVNRWALQVGLKSWAREKTPIRVKRLVKRIYFRDGNNINVTAADKDALRDILIDDACRFRNIFERNSQEHASISRWPIFQDQ